jgi:hypothetical protein
MFGFSAGDWIFIVLIFITIVIFVSISDMFSKKK